MNGWDEQALQKGLDTCVDGVANCPEKVFGEFYSQTETQECKLPAMIDEKVTGSLKILPGCNTVTYGPEPASSQKSCAAPKLLSAATPQMAGYVDVTGKGYKYLGCGKDNAGDRTLSEELLTGDDMTVEKCIDFCKSKSKAYAGLEYSGQCYCSGTLADDRAPVKGSAGNCLMKCSGDESQVCGGADAISLYQACSGGACTNAAKRQSRRLANLEIARANAAI